MAWEQRNGRGRYYTRSRKVNGRVVREYVGTGIAGELAAAADKARRAERSAERAAVKAEIASASRVEAELREVELIVDLFTRGALLDAGFERTPKREWRRRRDDGCTNAA